MKDAIAYLSENSMPITVLSKNRKYTFGKYNKQNSTVICYRAVVETFRESVPGTRITVERCDHILFSRVRDMSLDYSPSVPLFVCKNGSIYRPTGVLSIYVAGLKTAENREYAFSYAINVKTAAIRNHERAQGSHRRSYSASVVKILTEVKPSHPSFPEIAGRAKRGTHCVDLSYAAVKRHFVSLDTGQNVPAFDHTFQNKQPPIEKPEEIVPLLLKNNRRASNQNNRKAPEKLHPPTFEQHDILKRSLEYIANLADQHDRYKISLDFARYEGAKVHNSFNFSGGNFHVHQLSLSSVEDCTRSILLAFVTAAARKYERTFESELIAILGVTIDSHMKSLQDHSALVAIYQRTEGKHAQPER